MKAKNIKAVILAAGMGSRISPLTDNCPKSLLKVGDFTILERMLAHIRDAGIRDILIILGYREEQIREYIQTKFSDLNVHFTLNHSYGTTNTAFSLLLAESFIGNSTFIKFDADVVFDKKILLQLIDSEHSNCLCIDKNINLAAEEIKVVLSEQNTVSKANKSVNPTEAAGESIGIEKIDGQTSPLLFKELMEMMKDPDNHQKYYETAYERLIEKNIPFHTLDITGLKWTEIDTHEDLAVAETLFKRSAG